MPIIDAYELAAEGRALAERKRRMIFLHGKVLQQQGHSLAKLAEQADALVNQAASYVRIEDQLRGSKPPLKDSDGETKQPGANDLGDLQ